MSEQNRPNPAPRRRRKPQRPKWVTNKFTYQLWRNWPLIRFVLLCLLALTLLISAVSCTVSAIGGLFDKDPAETTEPLASQTTQDRSVFEQLEKELLEEINALGIGPQGFGGRTTALGVNILAMPTHIAGMPCAININCHVTRHKSEVI